MSRALRLAQRGLNTTTPNPRVGCVIVRDGRIVGEGWHERAGEPHAEVHALRAAADNAKGATAYVSLEPCSHHGRTPPCTQALIASGVTRVVAALQDPNPRVGGEGLRRLQAAGIQTQCGLLEEQAREINIGFVSRMQRGRPWVRVKIAASLDGRTALRNGVSQWITGPDARRDGHVWRARSCAVMTGIGTLLADNPRLTVREVATTRQPKPLVVDRCLRLPLDAHVLEGGGALVATATADPQKIAAFERVGAEVIVLPDAQGKVDLPRLMQELGRREMNEILVESGRRLNGALVRAGLVDELVLYFAPQLLGDAALGMFDLPELTALEQRIDLKIRELRRIGEDLRILARLAPASAPEGPRSPGRRG
jgi:diaminohydroxyphosphoribosylaminopyrimidine deaminase/5-amino-6-(5-phosphoribosylamino)uracil reductase